MSEEYITAVKPSVLRWAMRAGTFLCIGLLLGLAHDNSETFSDEMREYFRESSWQVIGNLGGKGSAVFIQPHLLLTSHHVVINEYTGEAASYITIRNHDRSLEFPVSVIKSDGYSDLALLYCECPNYIPMIRPIARRFPKQGERVYSAGYGLSRHMSMVSGEAQGNTRDYGGDPTTKFISVPTVGGDSGSGVINEDIELVGIRVAVGATAVLGQFGQVIGRAPVYHIGIAISPQRVRGFLRAPVLHHNLDPYYETP